MVSNRVRDALARVWRVVPSRRPSPRTLLLAGAVALALLLVAFFSRRSGPPTFRELAFLEGAGSRLVFSADGETLATWEGEKVVHLWRARTGERKSLLEFPGSVRGLALSPDGTPSALLVLERHTLPQETKIFLQDARTWERAELEAPERVIEAVFSPDGRTLAIGSHDWSDDRTVRLWDVPSRRLVRILHESEELPEPKADPAAGDDRPEYYRGYGAHPVAFSPDGKLLASVHGGHKYVAIKLWNVRIGEFLRRLDGVSAGVQAIIFLPGSKTLAASFDGGRVVFFGVGGGKPLGELEGPHDRISGLAVSPDGVMLATGSSDAVGLWDLRTGKRTQGFDQRGLWPARVAFSPDGKTLAAVQRDGVRLWQVGRP